VLALDEPFASLDAITRAEMQAWLASTLGADPRTVVLVTHDVEEALYLSDSVAVLSGRPSRVVHSVAAPAPRVPDRDAAVTDSAFVAVREEAMHALREASGR
jgi:NitT/TauT family transport system ATP-binding protein